MSRDSVVGQVCVCDYSFFFQAEDGIRDAQESRGLGDVYKRQPAYQPPIPQPVTPQQQPMPSDFAGFMAGLQQQMTCLLYTSDAADDLLCVDLGGRRIIKKKNNPNVT